MTGALATRYRSSIIVSTALLHFDGTNGSTTFTDVYSSTWSGSSATLSTAQQKFGPSSLLLPGGAFISTSNDIFAALLQDWTYEAFVYAISIGGSQVIFGSQGAGFSGVLLFLNGGVITLLCGSADGGTNWSVAFTSGATLSTGTWYHVAGVRHGNNFNTYLNGVSQGSATYSGSIIKGMTGQAIGAANAGGTSSWNGYVDEARISMGVARYTANFTPPAAPFTY